MLHSLHNPQEGSAMPERMKVYAKRRQNEQLNEQLNRQLNGHRIEHRIELKKHGMKGFNTFNFENSTEKAWQWAGIRVMDISLLLKSGWKGGCRSILRRIYLRDGLPCRIIVSAVVPGGIPA
jgi:hypothetical protein